MNNSSRYRDTIANLRRKIRAKYFALRKLPDDNAYSGSRDGAKIFAKTATTLPVLNNAHRDYYGGRTAGGEKINILLVHCTQYHMGVNQEQNLGPKILASIWTKSLGFDPLSYGDGYSC